MKVGAPGSFGGQLKALREAAGYTQEELATIAGLSVHAVSAGDDAWAARIQGARDAVTERTGATVVDKSVHDLREQAERDVRARLGPDRWARAYAVGRTTCVDALLKDIDSAAGPLGSMRTARGTCECFNRPQRTNTVSLRPAQVFCGFCLLRLSLEYSRLLADWASRDRCARPS
jgi:hypothetical protein